MVSHLKCLCFVGILAVAGAVSAGSLIECPDCDQPVSYRALLCLHCGCPGDAIKEAAALREAELAGPPLLPVARVASDAGPGCALAVVDGDKQYLVMDMQVLGGMSSLDIMPLTTNAPISYRNMQVASLEPLVRFETDATNLFFMGMAHPPHDTDDAGYWLLPDGMVHQSGPRRALAAVDVHTNVVGIVAGLGGEQIDLREINWIPTGPAAFRQELLLIKLAEQASAGGQVPAVLLESLRKTEWISGYLNNRANILLDKHTKETP